MLEQAVVLCGGKGSRLGHLTSSTPKPMLPIAGRPFLDHLIQEVARYGVQRILLLAGRFGEQIASSYDGRTCYGASIAVLVEPQPLGTGGALRWALDYLDPHFLLLNGDSWIDADLTSFALAYERNRATYSAIQAQMLLRHVDDAGRFGCVDTLHGMVTSFREKEARSAGQPGHINAGVYALNRRVIESVRAQGACSLEIDVLPGLVDAHGVAAVDAPDDRFFIDIGLPETLASAERSLISARSRPAVFFDRDGTLNRDYGYVHRPEHLEWMPGAREAVAWANTMGYFVFVVTNQSGVARGFYAEEAILEFHRAMQSDLFELGAHIDAIEWCPNHIDGMVAAYACPSSRRKPEPGMLLDLVAAWPVDLSRSLMIGDSDSDMAAGEAAGIGTARYSSGSLLDLLRGATLGPGIER